MCIPRKLFTGKDDNPVGRAGKVSDVNCREISLLVEKIFVNYKEVGNL